MVCGKLFRIWRRGVTYSSVSGDGLTPRSDIFLRSNLAPRCVIIPQWSHSAGWQIQGVVRLHESILVCWWPLLCVQGPLQCRTCPWVTCRWSRDSSPSLSGKYCLESILTAFTVLQYKADVTVDSKLTFNLDICAFYVFCRIFFLKVEWLNLPLYLFKITKISLMAFQQNSCL